MKNKFVQKLILLSLVAVFSFLSMVQARTSYRSAKTGRYITKSYYYKHPATTYKSKR